MGATAQRPGAPMGQPGLQNGGRRFSSQGMPNGGVPNGSATTANRHSAMMNAAGMGVPQAQMQSYLQGQHGGMSPQAGQDASRVMTEAMRVQEQQRLMQRQARTQPNGAHQPNHNAAMLAGGMPHGNKLSSANGVAGSQQRSSASPSMPNAGGAQQMSGSSMVPVLQQITTQLQAQNPNATSEQIKQMATRNLNQRMLAQNAQGGGMNGHGPNGNVQMQHQQRHAHQQGGINYNPTGMSPQQYAQFLRMQQANQQSRHVMGGNGTGASNGGGGGGGAVAGQGDANRPVSRGTPGSQGKASVATNVTSSSPRPPQAQMAARSPP